MTQAAKTAPRPPRIEDGRTLLIAGPGGHFSFGDLSGLPDLWQRFRPRIGNVPGQVGNVAYGVCYNTDDKTGGFDYIAGVEVSDFAAIPKDFATLRLEAQRYAIFVHEAHISIIRATFLAIFDDWLPNSGYKSANAPPFERYDASFDPHTGMGGIEVWIPIRT